MDSLEVDDGMQSMQDPPCHDMPHNPDAGGGLASCSSSYLVLLRVSSGEGLEHNPRPVPKWFSTEGIAQKPSTCFCM
jgi:hypothetical protein